MLRLIPTARGLRTPASRARFCATLGAVGAAAAGRTTSLAAASAYTMRLGQPDAATSLLGLTTSHFSEAVEQRTSGQLKIEVYPNGQLAKQQEVVQGMLAGVIDFGVIGASFLVFLAPQFQIFDLPFLFKDPTAGYRVLDGPITAELYGLLEDKGIVGIASGIAGFKQIETTSKPITVPEDARGLRIRIQAGVVPTATYRALGAIPVAIDLAETVVALSQRTVDGTDFTIDAFTTFKCYAVAKCCAMANQFFSPTPLLASKQRLDALPSGLQRIVREEGRAAVGFWRSLRDRENAEQVRLLKQNGVAFTEVDHPAFRKAVAPVYASVQAKLGGDLFERFTRAATST